MDQLLETVLGKNKRLTKAQAIAEVKARGYLIQYDIGESGDCGWGSRLYFVPFRANAGKDGMYCQTATVSKVPGAGWVTSYFGKAL